MAELTCRIDLGKGSNLIKEETEHRCPTHLKAQNLGPLDRLVSHGSGPATAVERAGLQIASGALVHRIKRVRTLQEKPMATDVMAFPVARFSSFTWPRDHDQATVYGYLERNFGVMVAYVQERIRTCALAAGEARVLSSDTGATALEIARTAFDLSGMPVEFRRTVALTQSHHYFLELRHGRP